MRRTSGARPHSSRIITRHWLLMSSELDKTSAASFRSDWCFLTELLDDVFVRRAAFAFGMPEATATDPILNIEDQIIAWTGSDTHRDRVEPKRVPCFPGDNMVCAGCVSANA